MTSPDSPLPERVRDASLPPEQRRRAASDLVDELRRRQQAPARRSRDGVAGLAGIARASQRLRQIGHTDEMLRAGCDEAASLFGLERVVLSAVAGDHWRVLHVHGTVSVATGPAATEVALRPDSPEGIAVDTHRAHVLAVSSAVGDVAAPNEVAAALGHPHVLVPVVHVGTTIGLFHAAHDDHRPVDELETVGLTAFAGMMSSVWYCSAIESSWSQRSRAVHTSVLQRLDQLVDEPIGEFDDVLSPAPEQEAGGRAAVARSGSEMNGRALTPRERVVLRYVLEGVGNREIADELVLSVDTVKSHVKRILRKLGATNRTELIRHHAGPRRP